MAAAKSHTDQPASQTIVLVGGGSGGHITPLLAVAEELKKQAPAVDLIYIGQTGDKLWDVPKQHHTISQAYSIRAGKFRRYHGEGLKQFLDIKTMLKNVRDFFYFLAGCWQAFWLLGKVKPNVIFIKGGFVGVPVGLAAAIRRIPYVTHDSDAVPGLANRVIARWATAHTVALPKSVYSYPASKTHSVGVPVSPMFRRVTKDVKADYRQQLGLKSDRQVIFISGGGNGAKRLNEAVVESVLPLLKSNPKVYVIHNTGRDHESDTMHQYSQLLSREEIKQVMVKGFFVNDLYKYSGAADIIVARAGASSIAEFASQEKCCIIVPNQQLTGGHQLKNAQYLASQKAAIVLNDNEVTSRPSSLTEILIQLFEHPAERQSLAKNLGVFAKPRSAKDLAQILLEMAA